MSGQTSRAAAFDPGPAGVSAARPRTHRTLLAHLVRRWWAIALAIVFAFAIAAIYLATATPRYRGTALLASGYGATATGSIPPEEFLDAQRRIIFSEPVLAAGAEAAPGIDLRQALDVQTSVGDGSVSIGVESPDPQQAARAANAIAETYLRERAGAQALAGKGLSALTAQRDQRAAERAAAEKALGDFRTASAAAGADTKQAAGARLEQLNTALAAARSEAAGAASAVEASRSLSSDSANLAAAIESARSSGIFAGLDRQKLELADQLRAAEVRLEQQRQTMLPRHPVLIATRQEVEQLKLKRNELNGQYLQTYQQHLLEQQRAAQRKVEEIENLAAEQKKLVQDYSTHAARMAELEAGLKQADAALADADAKLREALLAAATGGPDVKLVQPARASARPIHPNRWRVLLLALGGGALAGVLLVAVESMFR